MAVVVVVVVAMGEKIEARLKAIEEQLESLSNNPYVSGPRDDPKRNSQRGRVLEELYHVKGWKTSSELSSLFDTDTTRPLARLWRSYLIDRKGDESGNYKYAISPLGVKVVESWNNDQQSLDDTVTNKSTKETHPWSDTDLNKGQYHALKVVHDAEGHQASTELEKDYIELGYEKNSSTTNAIAARLSELYDKGYVDRPPKQPYYYWVTEKGKKVLDDD